MLNRLFVVDSVTLTSTGTAVSSYTPWDQTTRKLPTQVVVKATGQGAYVRLSNDASAATNADVLVQAGDHVVLSVQGRRWVSVLSDGASSTVNVGALSTGVSGSAASLDLVFVDAGVLDPRVTFTRASTATYFNSAGVLTSAAINESRRDFDPATLAVRGLLIEEQRTNSLRNNTMQGAVAGTPGTVPTNWLGTTTGGGITRTIVGVGTEDGIQYIDIQYVFTGAANADVQFDSLIAAAANGQTWTAAQYVRLVGGSLTNMTITQILAEYSSAPAFLAATTTNIVPTSAALRTQRFAQTRTNNQASTAGEVSTLRFAASGAADVTLRIGLPQLEQGAFATSVIPTTTTALTRSADVASVNTLAPWYNTTEGTLFVEGSANVGVCPSFACLDDTTLNSLFRFSYESTKLRFLVVSGGVNVADLNSVAVYTATTTAKMAGAYKVNDFAVSFNGAAALTDTSGNVMPLPTRMVIGGGFGSTGLNGYLRRITYYPRRLSNAELQAITA